MFSLFFLNERLKGFYEGILDLSALGYFVGMIAVILFLCTQIVSARGWNENHRLLLGRRSLYKTGLCLGLVMMALTLLGTLPLRFTQLDLSTVKLYTLSDTGKDFLEGLSSRYSCIFSAREERRMSLSSGS